MTIQELIELRKQKITQLEYEIERLEEVLTFLPGEQNSPDSTDDTDEEVAPLPSDDTVDRPSAKKAPIASRGNRGGGQKPSALTVTARELLRRSKGYISVADLRTALTKQGMKPSHK